VWHAARTSSLVRMHPLALDHSQMMRLVMRPAHHDADETQATKMLYLLRVIGCDRQHHTVGQRLSLGGPAVQMGLVDLMRVCRNHALYSLSSCDLFR
jgi:hypothetical protein